MNSRDFWPAGAVYLVSSVGKHPIYKVGASCTPSIRILALRRSFPGKRLLFHWSIASNIGTAAEEFWIKRWGKWCISGLEWFRGIPLEEIGYFKSFSTVNFKTLPALTTESFSFFQPPFRGIKRIPILPGAIVETDHSRAPGRLREHCTDQGKTQREVVEKGIKREIGRPKGKPRTGRETT